MTKFKINVKAAERIIPQWRSIQTVLSVLLLVNRFDLSFPLPTWHPFFPRDFGKNSRRTRKKVQQTSFVYVLKCRLSAILETCEMKQQKKRFFVQRKKNSAEMTRIKKDATVSSLFYPNKSNQRWRKLLKFTFCAPWFCRSIDGGDGNGAEGALFLCGTQM